MRQTHRRAAKAAQQRARVHAQPKPADVLRVVLRRNVHDVRISVDHAKRLCHLSKAQRCLQLHDALFIKAVLTADPEQLAKVRLYGWPRIDILVFCQHLLGGRDAQLQAVVYPALAREDVHDALFQWAFALSVAAPRRLQNTVQTRHFAPHGREIHVHARFDEARRHHAARFVCLKTFADGFQRALAILGGHQRRKVIASFLRQHAEQGARALSGIDHAKHLRRFAQARRHGLVRQLSLPGKVHASKEIEQPIRIWRDLTHGQLRRALRKQAFKRRLRSRTQ